MNSQRIKLPFTESQITQLRVGVELLLKGVIYTARDAAHQRLAELIKHNQPLPLELKDQVLYYMGPTPSPKGRVIGAAGPTTSSRMDRFTPLLLSSGVRVVIGKGSRSVEVREALIKHRALYLIAFGGLGALYSKCIKAMEVIAFEDLGPEAIYRLTVEDFPVVVGGDIYGGDIYKNR